MKFPHPIRYLIVWLMAQTIKAQHIKWEREQYNFNQRMKEYKESKNNVANGGKK